MGNLRLAGLVSQWRAISAQSHTSAPCIKAMAAGLGLPAMLTQIHLNTQTG